MKNNSKKSLVFAAIVATAIFGSFAAAPANADAFVGCNSSSAKWADDGNETGVGTVSFAFDGVTAADVTGVTVTVVFDGAGASFDATLPYSAPDGPAGFNISDGINGIPVTELPATLTAIVTYTVGDQLVEDVFLCDAAIPAPEPSPSPSPTTPPATPPASGGQNDRAPSHTDASGMPHSATNEAPVIGIWAGVGGVVLAVAIGIIVVRRSRVANQR